AGGPLPGVAEHLPAAEGTVPGGQGLHRDTPGGPTIQVRPPGAWRIVPPRVTPLVGAHSFALALRFGRPRHFPLGLSGKTAPGPAAVGFRFVPVDEYHWQFRCQRDHAIVMAAVPLAVGVANPVDRVAGVDRRAPLPARLRPELRPAVTLGLHKTAEFLV